MLLADPPCLGFFLELGGNIIWKQQNCNVCVAFVPSQVQELHEEEAQWVNYDEDELCVKMQLADGIFEALIRDTVDVLNQINEKQRRLLLVWQCWSELRAANHGAVASLTPDLLSSLHVLQLDFPPWGSQAVQMGWKEPQLAAETPHQIYCLEQADPSLEAALRSAQDCSCANAVLSHNCQQLPGALAWGFDMFGLFPERVGLSWGIGCFAGMVVSHQHSTCL